MNFYTQQHEFYCGIDLHTTHMYACVVDQAGKKRLHRNFKTRHPEVFLAALTPFRKGDLVIGCESTFNWYWFADLCVEQEIPFVLGHALYLKAIHGGKTKNDRIDSEKLAMLLRGGNFPTSYVYPKEIRSTRDLMRRRTSLVRRRAMTLAHIQIVNWQQNLPPFAKKLSYKTNRAGVAERFEDPSVRAAIEVDLDLIQHYDRLIAKLELYLENHAKVHDPQTFYRLMSIPGVGRVLAMTMLYEIHKIERFGSVGDFLSYARLVRGSHTSNGKRYASSGHKIGNPHLKWAFSEAVCLFLHECEHSKRFVERKAKKHCKAKAMATLSAKLGRAVYWMLRRETVFDVKRFFAN